MWKAGVVVRHLLELETGAEPFRDYRLLRVLGRGGYADVWESTSPNGSNVALKFMRVEDAHAAAQEVRAIQAMKMFHHPHLIQLHEVWSIPGYVVISMELAEGSLQDLLEAYYSEYNTAILQERVCHYLTQVAEAIDFLNCKQHTLNGHRVAFVHGDIKPSNMLIFGETIKLADFGMSTPVITSRCHRAPVGTPEFAAPEIFQGWIADRTDQFSLAASYCLLRGGKLPYSDTPLTFREPYTRPKPNLTMLPEEERPIIAKGLATAPQDRWLNCTAMLSALCDLSGYSDTAVAMAN